jgi:predicted ArsR family transcriptional regulator
VIPGLEDLEALRALADPVRRRVYAVVAASAAPVSRDEAAAAAGLGRSLAAYHLDRLAASGLLSVSYGRPSGRRGPGAGRPAKLYTRADREFVLRAPPREYELVAEILLRAGAGGTPAAAAREVGRELGRAAPEGPIAEVLRARGYEPFDDDGTLRFANCPFDALAQNHRQVVCSLNLALVEGVIEGAGAACVTASLEPDRAGCCVAVR